MFIRDCPQLQCLGSMRFYQHCLVTFLFNFYFHEVNEIVLDFFD